MSEGANFVVSVVREINSSWKTLATPGAGGIKMRWHSYITGHSPSSKLELHSLGAREESWPLSGGQQRGGGKTSPLYSIVSLGSVSRAGSARILLSRDLGNCSIQGSSW